MQKKILVLGTGGTISSSFETGELGRAPVYSTKEILNFVPQLYDIAEISIDTPIRDRNRKPTYVDSTNMQPEYVAQIARRIFRGYKKESIDGAVVLGGTDSMEEYASYMAFKLPYKKMPVVVTGAMDPIDKPNSDGINNILSAVNFASLGIPGTYVVFHNRIIAGTRARKINPEDPDAFRSISFPQIGEFIDGKVHLSEEAMGIVNARLKRFEHKEMALMDGFAEYSTHLLPLYMSFKPSIIDYFFGDGYMSLIIEAFGTGGVPNIPRNRSLLPKIKKWSDDRLMFITSQTFTGQVTTEYEVTNRALQAGVISLRDMLSKTATVKGTWVFGQTRDLSDAKKLMLYPFENEINEQRIAEKERTPDEEVERIFHRK